MTGIRSLEQATRLSLLRKCLRYGQLLLAVFLFSMPFSALRAAPVEGTELSENMSRSVTDQMLMTTIGGSLDEIKAASGVVNDEGYIAELRKIFLVKQSMIQALNFDSDLSSEDLNSVYDVLVQIQDASDQEQALELLESIQDQGLREAILQFANSGSHADLSSAVSSLLSVDSNEAFSEGDWNPASFVEGVGVVEPGGPNYLASDFQAFPGEGAGFAFPGSNSSLISAPNGSSSKSFAAKKGGSSFSEAQAVYGASSNSVPDGADAKSAAAKSLEQSRQAALAAQGANGVGADLSTSVTDNIKENAKIPGAEELEQIKEQQRQIAQQPNVENADQNSDAFSGMDLSNFMDGFENPGLPAQAGLAEFGNLGQGKAKASNKLGMSEISTGGSTPRSSSGSFSSPGSFHASPQTSGFNAGDALTNGFGGSSSVSGNVGTTAQREERARNLRDYLERIGDGSNVPTFELDDESARQWAQENIGIDQCSPQGFGGDQDKEEDIAGKMIAMRLEKFNLMDHPEADSAELRQSIMKRFSTEISRIQANPGLSPKEKEERIDSLVQPQLRKIQGDILFAPSSENSLAVQGGKHGFDDDGARQVCAEVRNRVREMYTTYSRPQKEADLTKVLTTDLYNAQIKELAGENVAELPSVEELKEGLDQEFSSGAIRREEYLKRKEGIEQYAEDVAKMSLAMRAAEMAGKGEVVSSEMVSRLHLYHGFDRASFPSRAASLFEVCENESRFLGHSDDGEETVTAVALKILLAQEGRGADDETEEDLQDAQKMVGYCAKHIAKRFAIAQDVVQALGGREIGDLRSIGRKNQEGQVTGGLCQKKKSDLSSSNPVERIISDALEKANVQDDERLSPRVWAKLDQELQKEVVEKLYAANNERLNTILSDKSPAYCKIFAGADVDFLFERSERMQERIDHDLTHASNQKERETAADAKAKIEANKKAHDLVDLGDVINRHLELTENLYCDDAYGCLAASMEQSLNAPEDSELRTEEGKSFIEQISERGLTGAFQDLVYGLGEVVDQCEVKPGAPVDMSRIVDGLGSVARLPRVASCSSVVRLFLLAQTVCYQSQIKGLKQHLASGGGPRLMSGCGDPDVALRVASQGGAFEGVVVPASHSRALEAFSSEQLKLRAMSGGDGQGSSSTSIGLRENSGHLGSTAAPVHGHSQVESGVSLGSKFQ